MSVLLTFSIPRLLFPAEHPVEGLQPETSAEEPQHLYAELAPQEEYQQEVHQGEYQQEVHQEEYQQDVHQEEYQREDYAQGLENFVAGLALP